MEKQERPVPESLHAHATKEPLDLESRQDHLLRCPSCDHFIKADDININRLIAKCAHCNHLFSFEGVTKETGYTRPDMLIPSGLEVLKLQSELDIQVNWFRNIARSSLTFTLIFTLIWNLVLLPFVIMAVATGAYQMLLFTSAHIVVGIGMLLRLLAIFVNTTHVNVTRRFLEIHTSPLPSLFRRNRKIPIESIQQLYVTRYVDSRTNGVPNYAFALYAILKDGQKVQLVKGMNESTQKYLEYEIESFLGILDRRVDGAV
jgi:hypothetical protein